jgi:hypothetical protein
MRGSAQRIPGRPVMAALRAAWQGLFRPVHPDQREALPPCGNPAPKPFVSRTSDQRARPFGIRAQVALLPETPTRQVGYIPLPHHPTVRCRP